MPGVCSLSRPGARWGRAQVGALQCARPALLLMLLLQLQPPALHASDANSESHHRKLAQMAHRGLHLHTDMQSLGVL